MLSEMNHAVKKAVVLLTSNRLNTCLAEIDSQAPERFERLIEDMKRTQSITEWLKAENALEWIQHFNNIRACAREIVEREIIFVYILEWRYLEWKPYCIRKMGV